MKKRFLLEVAILLLIVVIALVGCSNDVDNQSYKTIELGGLELSIPSDCETNSDDDSYREYISYHENGQDVKNSIILTRIEDESLEEIKEQAWMATTSETNNISDIENETMSEIDVDGTIGYRIDYIYEGVRFNTLILLPVNDEVMSISVSVTSIDMLDHIIDSIKLTTADSSTVADESIEYLTETYDLPINLIGEVDIVTDVGAISDKEDAINAAEKVFIEVYGEEVKSSFPLEVKFDEKYKVWIIKGTLEENKVGGVPYLVLTTDGSIIFISHDK